MAAANFRVGVFSAEPGKPSQKGNDMKKTYLALRPSEAIVAQSAATIFAAYISAGLVREGSENEWMHRSVREAIRLAQLTDSAVTSDDEVS